MNSATPMMPFPTYASEKWWLDESDSVDERVSWQTENTLPYLISLDL